MSPDGNGGSRNSPLRAADHAQDPVAISSIEANALPRMLMQVRSFEVVLELVCECALADRRAASADSAGMAHLWPCPAGCIEFWATRHPDQLRTWLESWTDGRLPPQPQW